MRISGGRFKGRILSTVSGRETRPTGDKVKQAIFNILMHDIEDAEVLDLFAGSGALGIEAISRGAKSAVFVETGSKQTRSIRANLKMLDLSEEVLQKKCETACEYLQYDKRQFDLIFADPPYNEVPPDDVVTMVAQYDLLRENGLLIIEHKAGQPLREKWLKLLKTRKFGQTEISFFMPLSRKEE